MVEKRELTLEEVKAGVKEITGADPDFDYPHQGVGDERCGCVEVEADEEDDWDAEEYDSSECEWHMDDDNTCRYIHPDGSPACVIGHYYSKGLGMPTEYIAKHESRSPLHILESYGLTATSGASKFLNEVQLAQDAGLSWEFAYDKAEQAADKYEEIVSEALSNQGEGK